MEHSAFCDISQINSVFFFAELLGLTGSIWLSDLKRTPWRDTKPWAGSPLGKCMQELCAHLCLCQGTRHIVAHSLWKIRNSVQTNSLLQFIGNFFRYLERQNPCLYILHKLPNSYESSELENHCLKNSRYNKHFHKFLFHEYLKYLESDGNEGSLSTQPYTVLMRHWQRN